MRNSSTYCRQFACRYRVAGPNTGNQASLMVPDNGPETQRLAAAFAILIRPRQLA